MSMQWRYGGTEPLTLNNNDSTNVSLHVPAANDDAMDVDVAMTHANAISQSTTRNADHHANITQDPIWDHHESSLCVADGAMAQHIPNSNRGFRLLSAMGWRPGKGLGKDEEGRTNPIPIYNQVGHLGLGKLSALEDMGAAVMSSGRTLLATERSMTETDAERDVRASIAVQMHAIQEAVDAQLKVFYCADCQKQYQRAVDWDAHQSSYDHHHTKRLRESQSRERKRKTLMVSGGVSDIDAPEQQRRTSEQIMLEKQQAALSVALGMHGVTSGARVESDNGDVAMDQPLITGNRPRLRTRVGNVNIGGSTMASETSHVDSCWPFDAQ